METHSSFSPVKRFFLLLKPERKEIVYLYMYAIITGLISLSLPLGIQGIVSFITGGELSFSFGLLVGLVSLGTLVVSILQILQLSISEHLQRRIFVRAAFEFTYRLPRIALETLHKQATSVYANRFFDVMTIQKALSKLIIDLTAAVLQLILGLLLLSWYHPVFVFFGVIMVLILVLIIRLTWKKGIKTSLVESKYKYKVADWLEECMRAASALKMTQNADIAMTNTDLLVHNYLHARKSHFSVLVSQYLNLSFFKTLITGGLLLLGGILVLQEKMNLGQFIASEIIILLVISSAEKIISTIETIFDTLTSVAKIGFVTDEEIESESGLAFEKNRNAKGIELQVSDLFCQGNNREIPLINNLTFHIQAGSKAQLNSEDSDAYRYLGLILSTLYMPDSGSIAFNQLPVKNYHLRSLRSHIGLLSRNGRLFDGTILANITLNDPTISIERVMQVLDKINLTSFIRHNQEGLYTKMAYEGYNLTEDVISKILLARAIVTQPDLLIVDDSLLDIHPSELAQILNYLTEAQHNMTIIFLSNNPILTPYCTQSIDV